MPPDPALLGVAAESAPTMPQFPQPTSPSPSAGLVVLPCWGSAGEVLPGLLPSPLHPPGKLFPLIPAGLAASTHAASVVSLSFLADLYEHTIETLRNYLFPFFPTVIFNTCFANLSTLCFPWGQRFCCFAYWCTLIVPLKTSSMLGAVETLWHPRRREETHLQTWVLQEVRGKSPFILRRRRCPSRSQMIEIIEARDHGKTSCCPSWTLLFSSHPLVLPTPPCSPPRLLLNKLLWLEDTAAGIRVAWLRAAHHVKKRSRVEQVCDTHWTPWWRPWHSHLGSVEGLGCLNRGWRHGLDRA